MGKQNCKWIAAASMHEENFTVFGNASNFCRSSAPMKRLDCCSKRHQYKTNTTYIHSIQFIDRSQPMMLIDITNKKSNHEKFIHKNPPESCYAFIVRICLQSISINLLFIRTCTKYYEYPTNRNPYILLYN